MLALLIFGEQSCEQIHAELESGRLLAADEPEPRQTTDALQNLQRERLYFNRIFVTGTKGGRLFEELRDFDPAQMDNPRFDRLIASSQKSSERIESLFIAVQSASRMWRLLCGLLHKLMGLELLMKH